MEINTQLHYAELHLIDDIPHYPFDDMNSLLGFILAEATYDCVHLVCIDGNVFVTHDLPQLLRFIQSYEKFLIDCDVYWQEYSSYETAYKVALDMQEVSPFCYNLD